MLPDFVEPQKGLSERSWKELKILSIGHHFEDDELGDQVCVMS